MNQVLQSEVFILPLILFARAKSDNFASFWQTEPKIQHATHEFYWTPSFGLCRNKEKIQIDFLVFP